MRKVGAVLGLAITLATAIPASAESPRDRSHRRERHRHDGDDTISTGEGIALGALILGGIAALVASKARRVEPPVAPEDRAIVPRGDTPPAIADADSATAACAASAEAEGRRHSPIAQVAQVSSVDPVGPGFAIKGDLLVRASYRESGVRHLFRCSVDGDAVRQVAIDGLAVAGAPPTL